MRRLLRVLFLPLLLFIVGAAPATQAGRNPNLTVQAERIFGVLPSNWHVRVEGELLVIEREEPAQMISTAPSGPANAPTFVEKPRLTLVSSSAVTGAELAVLTKKNTDRAKALQMLASQMTDLISNAKPSGDEGGYRAANPDQQRRLDAYVAVHRALPYENPPMLFADDAAFYWGFPWYAPVDPAVQKELSELTSKIELLYAKAPVK